MYIKGITCLIFLLHLATAGAQQVDSIDFVLLNQETGMPVEDAFIFYENSSIGTTSDANGIARLPQARLSNAHIVITHINFENYNISPEQVRVKNKIELHERSLSLDMIIVKSKKLSKRKRKKWMKRFEKAFLGEKISKKKIRILNPEVLWFEETEDLLSAYAVDNIKILNEKTGYEMQVALDHFSLTKEEDIKYIGQIFFKDITDQFEDNSKIIKTRHDNFINSRQLFYKALNAQHPVLEKQFDFGITKKATNGELAFNKLNWQELNWQITGTNNIVFIDSTDYLTVMNKDILAESSLGGWRHRESYKLHFATTFLRSRTGKFVFSDKGELLNKKDIEESGFWTNHRIAKELPLEYNGNISFNKQQHSIIKKLVDYELKQPPEKVYIHTDKNIYFPYETLWFKAYVLNAVNQKPSELSKVLYVELLNEDCEIVQTWMLHKDIGYAGDYVWNPNVESGDYLLRAYTNYMRNEGADYFFEKKLQVRNPTDLKTDPKEILKDSIAIVFYPEGGDLISGLSSNVTVKATKDGAPFDISAQLKDEDGHIVTEFKTMHKGMGILNFIPKENVTYTLHTEFNNEEFLFKLPDSKQSGITLEINPTQKDYVYVKTKVLNPLELSGAYLVGHVRGSVFAYLTDLDKAEFKLAKSSMPTGLVHFTVFDNQNRPQSERIIFNEYGYNNQVIHFDTSVNVNATGNYLLKIDSLLKRDLFDLSASVVDVTDEMLGPSINIKNYLFIQSDLKEQIAQLDEYLKQNTTSNLYYLDLYMRSIYWRRFNWKDLLEHDEDTLQFHAEKNFSITGVTSKADSDEGIEADITLNTLGPDIIYNQKRTERNGVFSFLDIPVVDSTEIFLQARLNKGNENKNENDVQLKGNRLVDIHVNTYNSEGINKKTAFFIDDTDPIETSPHLSSSINDYFLVQQRQDSGIWQIDIDEIEISAKKSPATYTGPSSGINYVDFDQANWIAPETHGVQLINKVAPSLRFTRGAESKLVRITTNNRGEVIYVPMQVIIDGVGYNPEGSTVNRFNALPADRIKSMVVAGNAIIVNTRKIPRSTEKYLKSGILSINHPGYNKAREFSSDQKTNYPVLSTIYWTANLELNPEGHIVIPLNVKERDRDYLLTIEGVTATGKVIGYSELLQDNSIDP